MLIGILLAAIVFVPVPGRGQYLKVLQDFGHAVAFGCIAVAVWIWLRASRPSMPVRQRYVHAFLIAVTLGAATELLQFAVRRDPSWADLRSDALGAAAFLGFVAAVDRRWRAPARALCAVAAASLLIAHSIPTITMLRAYERRAAIFPVLAIFIDARDLYFTMPQWATAGIVQLPDAYAVRSGETALHVKFLPGDYPGIDFFEPSPDWRDFERLAVDLVNPTLQTLALTLRTQDVHHNNEFVDRLNRRIDVPPQTRMTVTIPVDEIESAPQGRSMDLQQMADFLFLRDADSAAQEMYLVSVRLEEQGRKVTRSSPP